MTGYDEFAGGRVAGNKNDISAWIADSAAWLPVVTWPAEGHEPRGLYVEQFWLPIIGPSALLAWWRLRSLLDLAGPSGLIVDCAELAARLGLGHACGRNAPIVRTLARLCRFGFARIAHDCLEVRAIAPTLDATQHGGLARRKAEAQS